MSEYFDRSLSVEEIKALIEWALAKGAVRVRVGEVELVVPPPAPELPHQEEPKDPAKKAELAAKIRYRSA